MSVLEEIAQQLFGMATQLSETATKLNDYLDGLSFEKVDKAIQDYDDLDKPKYLQ